MAGAGGADTRSTSAYGATAADLAADPEVRALLGVDVPADAPVPSVPAPVPASSAAIAASVRAVPSVAMTVLPNFPPWTWLDAAMKAGERFVEGKGATDDGSAQAPLEVRVEKLRRRKRDRMLYNFWIPLLLGTRARMHRHSHRG
jgi:hypothetical protein